MKLINGLLDYSAYWQVPDVYLFTGNPVVKNNGAIVMGRGAAKQVRDSFPGIDKAFGQAVRRNPKAHILSVTISPQRYLGWFKVKDHWAEDAKVELIDQSVNALRAIAIKHRDTTYHMNYPGIGNGKLDIKTVHHILQHLPDNVRIYK